MKWGLEQPTRGSVVRVRARSVYHYGVFVSEEEVVQFGRSPALSPPPSAEDIAVVSTDIQGFLLGEFLEVAEFDKKEKGKKYPDEEIVRRARARLGERGYHLLYNNCEHFVFDCAFGEHISTQASDRADPAGLVTVYVAKIPDDLKISPVYPKERREEIAACKNARVRQEKYAVWELLKYGVEKQGLPFKKLRLKKQAQGGWRCEEIYFSLSHSRELAVVALSARPVGVDIERMEDRAVDALMKKAFTKEEEREFSALPKEKKLDYFIERWTKKESVFKRDGGSFHPSQTECTNVQSRKIGEYYLSVAVTGEQFIRLVEVGDELWQCRKNKK